jgi:hypothetical protein
MRFTTGFGFALLGAAFAVGAQRPDCPVQGAPMPMRPPGKPPDFVPQAAFPATFPKDLSALSAASAAPAVVLPVEQNPLEAEEGHITALVERARQARQERPPADVMAGIADVSRTPLSTWRFEGYERNPSWTRPRCDSQGNCSTSDRHRVVRYFSRDGSTVELEEWNMAADGAAIVGTGPSTLTIGGYPGHTGGLRSPSGCVSATLGWHGDGRSASLHIAGPMSLEQQRAALLDLANSIESAARRR